MERKLEEGAIAKARDFVQRFGKQQYFGSGSVGFGMPGAPTWGDEGGWSLNEELAARHGITLADLDFSEDELREYVGDHYPELLNECLGTALSITMRLMPE